MGAVSYGYRDVPGKPGERKIDPAEAAVVQRIFAEYANGVSPRDIASGLTRDKIPAPSGAENWSYQSFIGGGGKNGMLRNRLYIGEIVYNRHHSIRNPDSGALTPRLNPKLDHISTDVPHLRIIEQGLWDAVQAVRNERSIRKFGDSGLKVRGRRGTHLLSGLLRCGQCNGPMIFTSTSRGHQFVSCAAARTTSACSHAKTYNADLLKQLVIENLRANLTDPSRQAEALKAAHTEYATLAKKNSGEKVAAEKQISRLTVQINRLVDAIENSDKPVQELMASLQAKDAERVGLIERVRLLNSTNVVTLHPHVIESYRQNVDKLHEALTAETLDVEVVSAFRNLVDCIVVQPTGYRQPYVVDAYGRLSAVMGVNLFPTVRSSQEIIEEEGVTSASAALAANHSGQVQRGNTW
jgi:site-specific DNA recombinase